jgi:hypothetical protein
VKRRLLSLARRAHIPPPLYPPRPTPTPPPQEVATEPQETNGHVGDPSQTPEPKPKPEPPVRVVRRTRRWYDGDRVPFDQMKF